MIAELANDDQDQREHVGAVHGLPAAALRVFHADPGHHLPAHRGCHQHRLSGDRPHGGPLHQPRSRRHLPRHLSHRPVQNTGERMKCF